MDGNAILHKVLTWIEQEVEKGLHDPSVDAKVESLLKLGWTKTKEQLIELVEKWDGTEDSLKK
ncbi:hypothetical protein MVUOKPPV_CDS0225 [Klebsiella phage phi1_175008]|uniref:Uncharacterized protein n=3 Tax=Stephanstirmvirinae TaxID=2946646 RepID=A0AAU8HZW5_9CAUD